MTEEPAKRRHRGVCLIYPFRSDNDKSPSVAAGSAGSAGSITSVARRLRALFEAVLCAVALRQQPRREAGAEVACFAPTVIESPSLFAGTASSEPFDRATFWVSASFVTSVAG